LNLNLISLNLIVYSEEHKKPRNNIIQL